MTYLFRQIISADVDGCAVLLSFFFEEEAATVVEVRGLCPCDELSDASPPTALLFFFFAILQRRVSSSRWVERLSLNAAM